MNHASFIVLNKGVLVPRIGKGTNFHCVVTIRGYESQDISQGLVNIMDAEATKLQLERDI